MPKEITGSKAFSKRFKKAMDDVWGKKRDNPLPYRRRK
jgi:hypothetical protein